MTLLFTLMAVHPIMGSDRSYQLRPRRKEVRYGERAGKAKNTAVA